jgi:hypothetical protein
MTYLLRAHTPVSATAVDDTQEETPFDYLSRGLQWTGLGISLGMWGVIGFLLWIPLLVRATLSFAVSLVHATLTSQTAERPGMVLKDAINFYRRGFAVAIDAVHGAPKQDPDDVPLERGVTLGSAMNEMTWAVMSWYFLLLFVGIIETSPLDMWRAFASQPWLEMLNVQADAFNAWVSKTLPGLRGGK